MDWTKWTGEWMPQRMPQRMPKRMPQRMQAADEDEDDDARIIQMEFESSVCFYTRDGCLRRRHRADSPRTPRGVQSLLDDIVAQLRLCGLEISAGLDGKSASLRIDVDRPEETMDRQPAAPLGRVWYSHTGHHHHPDSDYLGVPLSPMTMRADVADRLNCGLDNISAAPLKPQQRLFYF
ncbi:hypothetical protein OS493_034023 [Desmophyllum pertusum]|uniref:Uncharacterized protein n=1 Tax=Desmophyllum pertusum TaxID=174260 RepID=A0A9W9Z7R0_9CNID|nr:hypothetical protein OS493_034023 [Desmophyllum pertusum]